MHVDLKDDMRQAFVIAKNEVRKFRSGRKLYLFGALIALVIVMYAAVPYLIGNGYDNPFDIARSFLGMTSLLLMLSGVMFASTTIVSEYEERTALIVFTRPVRKWTIFIGKLIACFVIIAVFMAIMYVFTAVYSMAITGSVVSEIGISYALCLCGIFGICGFSMLMSTIAKKASTASVMTLVMLLLIMTIIAGLLETQNIDTSWLLISALGAPAKVLGGLGLDSIAYDAGVLVGWGIVCNIVGLYLFKRRDL